MGSVNVHLKIMYDVLVKTCPFITWIIVIGLGNNMVFNTEKDNGREIRVSFQL